MYKDPFEREELQMSTRWTLVIPEETDQIVRSHLALSGMKKRDLSRFVHRAVRQAVSWETVNQFKDQSEAFDASLIEAEVNESKCGRKTLPGLRVLL
jgi:hypothetical protein